MSYRYHGFSRIDPRNPQAVGVCDRCSQVYNLCELVKEMEWRGQSLMPTGFRVCTRTCLDIPFQFNRPRILPPDPPPVFDPRPLNCINQSNDAMASEDGFFITAEDGSYIISEESVSS